MMTNKTALKVILIGEDDPDDQDLLKEVFSSLDNSCSLIFTSNGSQLLNYLENSDNDNLPGLIILDYNMPELNGAEILKELKIKGYDSIPKIIWSTSSSDRYKDDCLELGANDYIVKPSKMNDQRKIACYMLSFWKKQ